MSRRRAVATLSGVPVVLSAHPSQAGGKKTSLDDQGTQAPGFCFPPGIILAMCYSVIPWQFQPLRVQELLSAAGTALGKVAAGAQQEGASSN